MGTFVNLKALWFNLDTSCVVAGYLAYFYHRIEYIFSPILSFFEQNTQPEYKGTDDTGCEYTFEWTTQAACALGSEQETVDASKCQLHDENTDFTFNLMPLKKRGDEEAYETGGYKV